MYELHLEETPGAVEVWVVLFSHPVETICCQDGPAIRRAVDHLREKYDIEDDDDVEPFADDAEALEALQAFDARQDRRTRRRLERQAPRCRSEPGSPRE